MSNFIKITFLVLLVLATLNLEKVFYTYEFLKKRSVLVFKHFEYEYKHTSWEEFVEISNKAKKNKDLKICQQIKSETALQDLVYSRESLIAMCEDGVTR